MEYHFEGTRTLKDYVKLCKKLAFKRELTAYIIWVILALFVCLYPHPIARLQYFMYNPLFLMFALGSILVGTIVLFIIASVINPITYKQAFKSLKYASIMTKYTLTEETICITNEISNTVLPKDALYKIVYDHDRIYVFYSKVEVIIIKKSFFENEKEYENLKKFIADNYGKKR